MSTGTTIGRNAPKGTGRNGASAGHKARIKELEAENAQLRATLGLDEPRTLESWFSIPEKLRDQFAAHAVFRANGSMDMAIRSLGFKPVEGEFRSVRDAVFNTPGCQAILNEDLTQAEEHRKEIVGRLVATARHGSDAESVRAAQTLAKLEGWVTDAPVQTQVTVNLASLVSGTPTGAAMKAVTEERSTDIRAILGHEPGPAERVIDEIDERAQKRDDT